MLFSIFTPTHDPKWIEECYSSLKKQTYENWEWVVLVNGSNPSSVFAKVYSMTLGDSRVKIKAYIESVGDLGSIGHLKKTVCSYCSGDAFVELDHDDQLTPDCLEELRKAIGDKKEAFVFSDDVYLGKDDKETVFSTYYGWKEPYPYTDENGKSFFVNKSFPITPAALAAITYCPDHVRCWTRSAYEKAGGFSALKLGDDHELMVKTYLAGVEMIKIPKCLYIHKLRNESVSLNKSNEITAQSLATRDLNLYDLVEEWCRRNDLAKVDVAVPHQECPKGWISMNGENSAQDIRSRRVGCIRAHDYLQCVPVKEVPSVLRSLHSLLVPGGYLLTKTPAVCDDQGKCAKGAFQSPNHVSYWSNNNWWYYTKESFSKYAPEIDFKFVPVRLFTSYPSTWHEQNLIPYVYADMVKDYPANSEMWLPGIRT